jgi:membrane protein required for colicin V production
MPVTILDLVVLGVVVISALLAAVRGFTREVLAIGSWIAAAVAAWILHPQLLPFVQQHIPNKTAALVAAIAAIFLLTLIVVSLITARISDFVLDSRIGALDRTLGFIFGGARGLLLCVIGYMFFTSLVPEKAQPVWARDAKTKPILQETGRSLIGFLPQDINIDMFKNFVKPKDGEGTEAPMSPRRRRLPPRTCSRRRSSRASGKPSRNLRRLTRMPFSAPSRRRRQLPINQKSRD